MIVKRDFVNGHFFGNFLKIIKINLYLVYFFFPIVNNRSPLSIYSSKVRSNNLYKMKKNNI
jgi:hypothetical protein